MITIDYVSENRKKSSLNYDKMTDRYVTNSISMVVPSPNMWTIEKNYYFLLQHSQKKQFNKKYVMKPSYLSYDEYGTIILSNMLMYMNGINSLEDFDMNMVIIPDLSAIVHITGDIFSDRKVKDLSKIDW